MGGTLARLQPSVGRGTVKNGNVKDRPGGGNGQTGVKERRGHLTEGILLDPSMPI